MDQEMRKRWREGGGRREGGGKRKVSKNRKQQRNIRCIDMERDRCRRRIFLVLNNCKYYARKEVSSFKPSLAAIAAVSRQSAVPGNQV